jgi:CheY-like chemotaxis protein
MANHVLAAVSDLFFRAKIRAVGQSVGREVAVATTGAAVLERARAAPPQLIVIDLADRRFDACEVVRSLKADPTLRAIPVIGFFPHVLADMKREAVEAGCDSVLPRSAFSVRLPALLAAGAESD